MTAAGLVSTVPIATRSARWAASVAVMSSGRTATRPSPTRRVTDRSVVAFAPTMQMQVASTGASAGTSRSSRATGRPCPIGTVRRRPAGRPIGSVCTGKVQQGACSAHGRHCRLPTALAIVRLRHRGLRGRRSHALGVRRRQPFSPGLEPPRDPGRSQGPDQGRGRRPRRGLRLRVDP